MSDGVTLGAREIGAMRVLPELVFFNCSFTPPLAASFARELIEAGVPCVVVAAGPIDDRVATVFATTLYATLMEGARFADAAARAREACHREGGHTWACYHCYGDPDWIFTPGPEPTTSLAATGDDVMTISAPDDLLLLVETMTLDTQFGRRSRESLGASLSSLGARHESLTTGGRVAEAFGHAWSTAGDLERAIAWYERARSASDRQATIASTAQLGALQARLASKVFSEAHDSDRARTMLAQAIATLEIAVSASPTADHYSLCGAAFRRLAAIEADAGRGAEETAALERMRRNYYKAEELARAARAPDAYVPAMGRMASELALGAGTHDWPGLDPESTALARQDLEAVTASDPDFWNVVAQIELKVYEAVGLGRLASRRTALEHELRDVNTRVSAAALWRVVYESLGWVVSKYAARVSGRERHAAEELIALLRSFADSK
jgi:tetratricopeptide (TPR) repeat protein